MSCTLGSPEEKTEDPAKHRDTCHVSPEPRHHAYERSLRGHDRTCPLACDGTKTAAGHEHGHRNQHSETMREEHSS